MPGSWFMALTTYHSHVTFWLLVIRHCPWPIQPEVKNAGDRGVPVTVLDLTWTYSAAQGFLAIVTGVKTDLSIYPPSATHAKLIEKVQGFGLGS
jgi:hypothetical protein